MRPRAGRGANTPGSVSAAAPARPAAHSRKTSGQPPGTPGTPARRAPRARDPRPAHPSAGPRAEPGRQGAGRSPVRSSCLTTRSCSPPASPPLPPFSSIFRSPEPAGCSRAPGPSAPPRPLEPGRGRSAARTLGRAAFPLPPPSSAGAASTAQPLRPAPRLPRSRPAHSQQGRRPCESPSPIGRGARAAASARPSWAALSDAGRSAPPRCSNCCCSAGGRRGRSTSDPIGEAGFCSAHPRRCARAVRTFPSPTFPGRPRPLFPSSDLLVNSLVVGRLPGPVIGCC